MRFCDKRFKMETNKNRPKEDKLRFLKRLLNCTRTKPRKYFIKQPLKIKTAQILRRIKKLFS